MMWRAIRSMLGCSRRDTRAADEAARHRAEQERAMRAVQMKVEALQTGADRMVEEGQKTEKAAAALVLLARLQEDFPQ